MGVSKIEPLNIDMLGLYIKFVNIENMILSMNLSEKSMVNGLRSADVHICSLFRALKPLNHVVFKQQKGHFLKLMGSVG